MPSFDPRRRLHWRANKRLTLWLLLAWAAVSFGVAYVAPYLTFRFLGAPFSFWMLAQGSLWVFCLIVVGYGWAMRRLDRRHDLADRAPPGGGTP